MPHIREELVFYAKLAEQTGRYEDMMEYMKQVAKFQQQLSMEEINLFSVALKVLAGKRRTALKTLQQIEQKEQNEQLNFLICQKKKQIEFEMLNILEDAIDIIDHKISNTDNQQQSIQSKIHYLKIKNESLNILFELDLCSDYTIYETLEANIKMFDIAKIKLKGSDASRIVQSINLFKYYYYICKDPTKAQIIGQNAIDEAKADEENMNQDSIEFLKCLQGYMNQMNFEQQDIY
ncbi:hypothetical protein ABPG72_016246 [Tetrahymena utriculariae]